MKNKIIIVLLTLFFCFFIYRFTHNNKKLYLALGDSGCNPTTLFGTPLESYNDITFRYLKDNNRVNSINKDYCYQNLKIDELIDIIKENERVSKNTIQNLIHDAKYITIMIGIDELNEYKNVDNLKKRDFLYSYNDLLKLIKKYNKGKVYVIGFYPNYFDKLPEINLGLKQLSINNGYIYIDTSSLSSNDQFLFFKNSSIFIDNSQIELFKILKKYL